MNVSYEQLVQNYCDGLFNKLRNFTPGPEFLDTWVHDEDDARSIFGVFEAAESAGLKTLSVTVGESVAAKLNPENLRAELSRLGAVEIKKDISGIQITVRFAHD